MVAPMRSFFFFSASTEIYTPPAPRLGYHDEWEPYTPRKSARISSQQSTVRTPSPATPRTSKKANTQKSVVMTSPLQSPRKKRQTSGDQSRNVSGTADGLGLPTPSKTPRKVSNTTASTSIQTFARNLFSADDSAMPKKRRGKKYSGMTMDSFTVEDEDDSIEIFTDSQDRIPVKDNSAENPFYSSSAKTTDAAQRRAKRRNVFIPGEGAQSISDAAHREDGMVYVFRGKKFFRKFSEDEDELQGDDSDAQFVQPLSRSSIKPRLLFPQEKSAEALEEEEATTDVEDNIKSQVRQTPATPSKAKSTHVETPEAPRFAPISPPDSKRATRSTNRVQELATPSKSKGRKSPFDSWPRIKDPRGQASTKRVGETLDQAPAKRTRA
ncbi:hypothetical protein VHEMI07410 [[Torrubiella] hemipterigena]|uniref:Uncharacterized protein n=1 Tax=[Torrubiella] hemipterigena TaxID=1531966 RepID=A0A0A1TMX7_9HYPO|nr:hypothetical protein VHEMI07410 [[Torrubiella] hemipterigena]